MKNTNRYDTVADQWTVEELSKKMLVPSTVLRRKIAYWQTQVEIQRIYVYIYKN